MTARRLVAVAAAVALLLSGCGADSGAQYCSALKSHQSIFADDGTGLELINNLAELKVLAAGAPDDLRDEWQTFLSALGSLRDAITAAHLKPTDFVDGKPPAGTLASTAASIAAAANELSRSDVVDAANGIEQQAKDVCGFQLGL